jgi:hypothetical protein
MCSIDFLYSTKLRTMIILLSQPDTELYMTESGDSLRAAGRFLKTLLILLLMIIVTVAAAGVFIYALYRVAVFSTTIYSIVFSIAFLGSILLFILRSVRRKKFKNFVVKVIKFFLSVGLIAIIAAAVLLYGAFVIRYPLPGIITTPILIFLIGFGGIKWKLFSFYRKFYQNL